MVDLNDDLEDIIRSNQREVVQKLISQTLSQEVN